MKTILKLLPCLILALASPLAFAAGGAKAGHAATRTGPASPQPAAAPQPEVAPTPALTPPFTVSPNTTTKTANENSNAALVKVRPRVTGEFIPDLELKTLQGEKISTAKILEGKFTILIFSKPENLWFESALGYFRKVVPYVRKLGYQIIVVTPDDYDYIRDIGQRVKAGGGGNGLMIDESRKSFVAMGLTDTTAKDGPSINAIFLVSPTKQIMFQFASVSDLIPFSGEVLVLAARVYRDAYNSDSAKPAAAQEPEKK